MVYVTISSENVFYYRTFLYCACSPHSFDSTQVYHSLIAFHYAETASTSLFIFYFTHSFRNEHNDLEVWLKDRTNDSFPQRMPSIYFYTFLPRLPKSPLHKGSLCTSQGRGVGSHWLFSSLEFLGHGIIRTKLLRLLVK